MRSHVDKKFGGSRDCIHKCQQIVEVVLLSGRDLIEPEGAMYSSMAPD